MYDKVFNKFLLEQKSSGLYREFLPLKKFQHEAYAYEQPLHVWCSNDYLGLSQSKSSISTACSTLEHYGLGAGGTRNIAGNYLLHETLEKNLALFHKKEGGLLFTSGYIANMATLMALQALLDNPVFFSDEKNHASIIQGLKGAEKHIFSHNSVEMLDNMLSLYPKERHKVIVVESVYSMDGTFGELSAFVNLAKKYEALLYVDEVHAVGLYGDRGAGRSNALNLENGIDFIQGNLGKAFGLMGGYVTSKHNWIDAIRLKAWGFIFTTALPPHLVSSALHNLSEIQSSDKRRAQMHANVHYLRTIFSSLNIPYEETPSHITPVRIGDEHKCKAFAKKLLDKGHYVQPINYPTVPKGQAMFRITVSSLHVRENIDKFAYALHDILVNSLL